MEKKKNNNDYNKERPRFEKQTENIQINKYFDAFFCHIFMFGWLCSANEPNSQRLLIKYARVLNDGWRANDNNAPMKPAQSRIKVKN